MSTMKVTNLRNESSSVNNIVLNSDGSVGGELGDALAAKADYPTGGSNGDLLTKSGTTTAWAAPSVAGLTLITTESFSAVSSVSINNCFTSTYANYLLIFDLTQSASGNLSLRLRASASDNTTSNYRVGSYYVSSNNTSGINTASASANTFALANSTGHHGQILVLSPQLTSNTRFTNLNTFTDAAHAGSVYGGCVFAATTQFDGFSIYPASGTFTGNVRVYGLQNG